MQQQQSHNKQQHHRQQQHINFGKMCSGRNTFFTDF